MPLIVTLFRCIVRARSKTKDPYTIESELYVYDRGPDEAKETIMQAQKNGLIQRNGVEFEVEYVDVREHLQTIVMSDQYAQRIVTLGTVREDIDVTDDRQV